MVVQFKPPQKNVISLASAPKTNVESPPPGLIPRENAAAKCNCLQGYSYEICLTYLKPVCQDSVEKPVDNGRRIYHADLAGDCLSGVQQILGDCSFDNDNFPPECDDMLEGIVKERGTCDNDSDCLLGFDCRNDMCTYLPAEGEACLDRQDCARDFFCGNDINCHAYRGEGLSCPEGDRACASDLYCDSRTTTCEPQLAAGQTCEHATFACDSDLYCASTTPRTCQPFPGSGESCAASNGICANGLFCAGNDICQSKKPDNQSCTDDQECILGNCENDICLTTLNHDCPL